MANSDQTQVELLVNGKQAEQELQRLRERADSLKKSLEDAYRAGNGEAAKHFKRELGKTTAELRKMESGTEAVRRTMLQLNKATPADLNRALKFLTQELKNIERGSDAWNAQVAKIKQVKAELDKVNAEMKVSKSLFERMKDSVNNWGASVMAGIGALSGLVMAGKKAVTMYAEMQQEEANVRKYTGMTEEQVNHLNEAFKKMDTRTSRDELNKLAQEAGRLGLQSEEDVLGFVKAADKINVALDDLGEGATLTLSKLTDIFGDKQRLGVEQSLLAVGSVINELSQNSTASAPYLAEFAQRLAGVGAQAQMSIPEIMGFGAVLDSQGQKLEMSATALSKVIMNLFKDPAKIAQATGLSIEQFSETCKRSTNEGLLMLLDRLHELGGIDALAPVFKDMGENGARASAVLAALAGNVDMVRQQQEAANVAFQEANSIDKEFNVQNTTVQANLEKARKGFQEMAITLGKELMPIVSKLISGTSMTMRVMLKVIQFVKEYRAYIVSTAAAIAGYTIVVNAAKIAEVAWNTVKKVGTAIQLAWNAAMMANPVGLLVGGLAAAASGLAFFMTREKEHIKALKQETEMTKKLNEIEEKHKNQFVEEAGKVKSLTTILEDNNVSLDKRRAALEELKKIVPDYHAKLTDEGKLINNNKEALDKYIENLRESIRLKANEEKMNTIASRQVELEDSWGKGGKLEGQKKTYEDLTGAIDDMRERRKGLDRSSAEFKKLEAAERDLIKKRGRSASQYAQALHEFETLQKQADEILSSGKLPSVNTNPTGGGGGGEETPDEKELKKQLEARLKVIDDNNKAVQAQNQIDYLEGKKDFKTYTDDKLKQEIEYHKQRRDAYTKGSAEYLQEEAARLQAEKNLQKEHHGQSVKDEQKRYSDEKAAADQRYADGKISAKAYQLELEQMELTHLQNLVNIYDEGSEERLKAQEKYNQTSLQYQRKHAEDAKRIQERLQKDYFSKVGMTTNTESYEEEKLQLEAVRQIMMAQATADQKLQIEEAYQKAKYELAKKYNDEAGMMAVDAAQASVDKVLAYMQTDGFQGFYQSFSTLVSGMGEIFSGLSSLIDAEVDLQEQKINKKYEAELKAAEGNAAETERIEAEKEKEIAQMKNEAEEKKYGMQIASTIAQTAISAVNAYSSAAAIPIIGWIMGPIAAGMALAAGGIQLATLKKQHEAAMAQGYAAGGYTAPGGKYQPAGIVHAGEWVASQELLANPTAAATIAQLDQAQRTNTIGQLSKPAPSIAIAKDEPSVARSNALQYSEGGNASVGEAIDRLNNTLDNGIYAATTMTGDKGILRQQRHYEQLMRNKSKK